MDFFSWDFLMALLVIIFIDLILAGDNAVVIGMAARNLSKKHQKQAIIWGTAGAVGIRIIATVIVVLLLKQEIPWLNLIGGLLLVWIAYKLLVDEDEHNIEAKDSLFAAIRTIVIADAAMGLDNVLAVAGAADGHITLVIIGLVISIPIVVWGSTIIIKWLNRYPWLIYVGAGVLAFTAAKMITGEIQLEFLFGDNALLKYTVDALIIALVLLAGKWTLTRKARQKEQSTSLSK